MSAGGLGALDRAVLDELAPVARRALDLERHSVARIRSAGGAVAVYVRLPFGVLVARTVRRSPEEQTSNEEVLDITVTAADLLAWLDGETTSAPAARDESWRTGLPPATGWARIETVPDDVIRPLVRSGALALKDAAAREGVPGAQPRAEVADALLDSVVLTAHDDVNRSAEVTLRALSALTRMGFLPRGGSAHIDAAGRWVRVVAEYGTVYLEKPGSALSLS